jgi:hypothetical protein
MQNSSMVKWSDRSIDRSVERMVSYRIGGWAFCPQLSHFRWCERCSIVR